MQVTSILPQHLTHSSSVICPFYNLAQPNIIPIWPQVVAMFEWHVFFQAHLAVLTISLKEFFYINVICVKSHFNWHHKRDLEKRKAVAVAKIDDTTGLTTKVWRRELISTRNPCTRKRVCYEWFASCIVKMILRDSGTDKSYNQISP